MEKVKNLALVIIDMQGPFTNQVEKTTIDMIISNQKELISTCKAKQIPVILVEYYAHGETTKEITKILPGSVTRTFQKKENSAFSSSSFVSFLEKKKIKNLIISGLFGNACILATSLDAIKKGYKIITTEDLVVMGSHIYQEQKVAGNISCLDWYKWNTHFFDSFKEISKLELVPQKSFSFVSLLGIKNRKLKTRFFTSMF